MAKGKTTNKVVLHKKTKRPGIHAKTKQSMNKNSSNYVKPYVGQGR